MRKLAKWFYQRSRTTRILLTSLAIAIPSYFSAYSFLVAATDSLGKRWGLAIQAVVFILIFTLIVAAYRYMALLHDEFKRTQEDRLASLLHAYAHIDRLTTENLARLDCSEEFFASTYVASEADLQKIVEAAYATLEAAFGKAPRIAERIDFEVTFMTISYKDNKLTVPACANREGRSPRSMILRQKDPDLYDNTITATVYREPRPSIHIIEDTWKPEVGYQELYAGQTQRIRSSIVFPVLSQRNELLGTLVAHCDRAGFFRQEDRRYWSDMLEIFARRLALVKAKLDALHTKRMKSGVLSISLGEPPF